MVELGPVKVLLDDDRLPSLADLVELVRSAHAEGRPAAVHCNAIRTRTRTRTGTRWAG